MTFIHHDPEFPDLLRVVAEARGRRFQAETDPAQFVRHYEDAAHIVQAENQLPPLDGTAIQLAHEMHGQRQVRQVPVGMDSAFAPGEGGAWDNVRRAYQAIAPMFWGERLALEDAATMIRSWINGTF